MLKPLAIGMMLLAAVSAGAAFAGDQAHNNYNSGGWNSVVNEAHFPKNVNDPCTGQHAQCSPFGDGGQTSGWWHNNRHKKPLPAPEVDPAGALGALTILAGLLAVLRGRRVDRKPA